MAIDVDDIYEFRNIYQEVAAGVTHDGLLSNQFNTEFESLERWWQENKVTGNIDIKDGYFPTEKDLVASANKITELNALRCEFKILNSAQRILEIMDSLREKVLVDLQDQALTGAKQAIQVIPQLEQQLQANEQSAQLMTLPAARHAVSNNSSQLVLQISQAKKTMTGFAKDDVATLHSLIDALILEIQGLARVKPTAVVGLFNTHLKVMVETLSNFWKMSNEPQTNLNQLVQVNAPNFVTQLCQVLSKVKEQPAAGIKQAVGNVCEVMQQLNVAAIAKSREYGEMLRKCSWISSYKSTYKLGPRDELEYQLKLANSLELVRNESFPQTSNDKSTKPASSTSQSNKKTNVVVVSELPTYDSCVLALKDQTIAKETHHAIALRALDLIASARVRDEVKLKKLF